MSKAKHNPAFALIFIGSGLILLALAGVFFVNRSLSEVERINESPASVVPAQVSFPAPELVLVDLSGKTVSFADFRGKVVLVNNWATWCPPCRAEMPELEAYYQAHVSEDFTLVGISAGDTLEQVKQFEIDFGTTFPMWLDPDNAALRAFRNDALPSTYVIDSSGMVRLAWSGAVSLETLEEYVTPLLGE